MHKPYHRLAVVLGCFVLLIIIVLRSPASARNLVPDLSRLGGGGCAESQDQLRWARNMVHSTMDEHNSFLHLDNAEACAEAEAYNHVREPLSNDYTRHPDRESARRLNEANVQQCLLNERCRAGNEIEIATQNPINYPTLLAHFRHTSVCIQAAMLLNIYNVCPGNLPRYSSTVMVPAETISGVHLPEFSCRAYYNGAGYINTDPPLPSLHEDYYRQDLHVSLHPLVGFSEVNHRALNDQCFSVFTDMDRKYTK